MSTPITEDEILAKQTPAGGWKRATLAEWGVRWPAPKGWKATLIEHGAPYRHDLNTQYRHEDAEPADDPEALLRKVVVAVINAGHASDLYEFPDVLAHFGAQILEDAA